MRVRIIVFLLLNNLLFPVLGQNNPLDKTVNIRFQQANFSEVLNTISDLGGFDYAFNPSTISTGFRFNGDFKEVKIGDLLSEVCQLAQLRYSEQEGTLFFKPEKTAKHQPTQIRIEGKINTEKTGNTSVKIKEPSLSLETYTDTAGRYVLILPVPEYTLDLSINLDGFQEKKVSIKAADETQFQVVLMKDTTINSGLSAQKNTAYKGVDTVFIPEITDYFPAKYLVTKKYIEAAQNENSVTNGSVNFQLIGGLGWPNGPTGKFRNKFSFNLSSYSAGLEGFELGGLNINRFDAKGVQFAFVGNANGGQTSGIQIGLLFNQSKLKYKGLQIALLYNESSRLHEGVQLSSFWNSSYGRVKGLQLAMVGNYSKNETKGFQAAVLSNFSREKTNGLQLAAFNYSKQLEGVQLGLVNAVDTVFGMQLGFVNYSKNTKGLQIGLVNLRDTVTENTVSVGLLNWVKGGFKALELNWKDYNNLQISFKTGGKVGYGILGTGLVFQDEKANFSLELGYGVKAKIRTNNYVLQELSWSHDFNSLENDRYAYAALWLHQWGTSSFYTILGPQLNLWKGDGLLTRDLSNWWHNDYPDGKSMVFYPSFQIGAGVRL